MQRRLVSYPLAIFAPEHDNAQQKLGILKIGAEEEI